ncbi:hypothetical protein PA598K_01426 [Paenibacillus sp. 598K]|uniref:hypothetical protein n=1 Tax=Paenibacillus sp. 598K TaxID=1117987 RepID=UPI000FF9594F|nr:hypothetical protein [Paenibacillus sp. 598K]GBF73141.1 hypothetical protein PA598K_01426 [Paenibacillus sp. 598K]
MFHEHRPSPNHKKHEPFVSGIAQYWLTDEEMALHESGLTHLIPTAEERGIKPEPVVYETNVGHEIQTGERRKRLDAADILTAEYLTAAMHNRMTINMIVQETGIAYSTVIKYMNLHGVENTTRKKTKGQQPQMRRRTN